MKLTDEQIIKSLECCSGKGSCFSCSYDKGSVPCTTLLINDVIDLINRQKAEIERLERINITVLCNMKNTTDFTYLKF